MLGSTLDESIKEETTAPKLANKKRLWVVTELYYPEETSTGYYLTLIAEGLADVFDTKAICGQPNYSARGTRSPKREIRNSVEIFRARGTTLNKNVIPFRIINMITLNFSILLKGLARFRSGDRILVVTTPPLLPYTTAFAALYRRAQYTLLIHDNYPEILIAAEKAREGAIFSRLLNFFNRWLYKYAAKIIVVGRDMRELIEAKTRGLDIPVVVIPNWAELETVSPRPKAENELLADLGLTDKFIFLYAGNLGHPNDLETLISCAGSLTDNEKLHFIFLGAGAKESWLRKTVRERGLTNVTILEPKPRSQQIVFLNACDVALVSLVKKMWGVSMPSRTYNILAAGKPILALTDQGSELAKVIDEEDAGWSVPPGQPELLLAAIREIYNRRDELDRLGKNARNAVTLKYSLHAAVEKYRRELV